MTREERKPTGLLHSADELKQLIVENPDLPILVFAGDNANNGDYSYMSCSYVSAKKENFLTADSKLTSVSATQTGMTLKTMWKMFWLEKNSTGICQTMNSIPSWNKQSMSTMISGSPAFYCM